MSEGTVKARLEGVRQRIQLACEAAGRDPDGVQLIAVSKKHPVDAVHEAATHGQVHFGENYAQELRAKSQAGPEAAKWHFIGRIQRNKAAWIARAHRVHTLTSVRHAEALVAKAPDGVDALVQVHVGGEASKGGVAAEAMVPLLGQLAKVDGLRVHGLMCIPPPVGLPADAGVFFAELAELAAKGRAAGFVLPELSMGMSADLEVAIQHGATWVRVGTAVFGARPTV